MQQIQDKRKPLLLSIVRWGVYLTLFTPLIVWNDLIHYFDSPKSLYVMGLIEVTALFFVWLIVKYPAWRPSFDGIGKSLFLFLVILVFTAVTGIDPLFSFWSSIDHVTGVIMWLHLFVFFVIITSTFRSQEDWKRIFVVSLIVAVIVCAIQLLAFTGVELIFQQRSGSTFGNSTSLGTYLLFQISFVLFLFNLETHKKKRRWILLAGGLFVFVLLMTQANAARIALVLGAAFFVLLFFFVSGRSRRQRTMVGILLCLMGVLGIGLMYMALVSGSFIQSYFIDLSSGSRLVAWDIAWQGIKERPLFGWGLENFQFVFLEYYDPCFGSMACGYESWFDRTHNKVLDLLIETGIVGLVSYLTLFIISIKQAVKAYGEKKWSSFALVTYATILFAYFLQNLVSLDTATTLFYFTLLLAFVSVITGPRSMQVQRIDQTVGQKLPYVILACSFSLLFPFSFYQSFLLPLESNTAVVGVYKEKKMEDHLTAFASAVDGSLIGLDLRRIFLAQALGRVIANLTEQPSVAEERFLKQEFGLIERGLENTIENTPNFLRAYLQLGFAYQMEGRLFEVSRYQDAERIFGEAIKLNPNNQKPYWAMAGLMLEQGDAERTLFYLDTALALDPRVTRSYVNKIVALRILGEEGLLPAVVEGFYLLTPPEQGEIEAFLTLDAEEIIANKYRHLQIFY